MLALQLEPLYAAEAKRRQATSTGGARPQLLQNSAKAEPLHTDEQLAKLAGTSRDTIRKVKVIETEAAKGNETAQTFAKVGIYADQRIGEILRELPKGKGNQYQQSAAVGMPTKAEAEKQAGIGHATAIDLQKLAANPDVVQAIHLDADSMHGAGSMRSRSGPETPHPSPSVCMTPRGADHSLRAAQMPLRAAQAPTDAPDGYVVGSCPCR